MSILYFLRVITRGFRGVDPASTHSQRRCRAGRYFDPGRFATGVALPAMLAATALAADPQGGFQIETPISVPVANQAGAGQRIFWESRPGLTYQLQTTTDLRAGPGANVNWTTVSTITAVGTLSWADDSNTSADSIRYYRVLLLAPTNDVIAPLLGLPQATQPPAPPASPVSILSVSATDNVGVVSVDFLDGNNLIGPATRGAGNTWNLDWPLGSPSALLSGRHYLSARALDASGNAGYSPVLAFDLAVPGQKCLTFGGVTVCADSEILANGVYTFSGNIQINALRLSGNASVTASATQIIGSGDVIVPGLDTILSGAFEIDPQSGWLTVRTGTSATFPAAGIALNSQANFAPTQLSVNVYSNYLAGIGSLSLRLPPQTLGPAVFSGSLDCAPAAGIAEISGSLILSNLLSATGKATLNLSDSSFTFAGDTQFQSPTGDTYYLSNSVVRLTWPNPASPALYVSGNLGVGENLALKVQGNIAATGEVDLTGTGRGTIGGFNFDPIEVTLVRPAGPTSATTARFRGKLSNPNFSGYLLAGTLGSSGDLDISGTGTVTFDGFVFNPLNVHLLRNASTANLVVANLDGTLRLSYIKPVNFTGILREDGSVTLQGQSGPYTVASFGGVAPRMDDPSLGFDEQTFIGCFQLGGRDVSIQTLVNFRFQRDADAAGGNSTLGVTAVTTQPTNPTLTLTGTASANGAGSLSGSLLNQQYNLWGYSVSRLGCTVSRDTQGVVTFGVVDGALNYGPLQATSSQASGTIASDGSGSIGFTSSSCTLGGYALQNVSLVLSQSSSGTGSLRMAAGSMVLPGFATETVALSGTLNRDGTFNLTGTTSDALNLNGLAVTSMARGATVTLTQNGLTITGTVGGGVLSQVISGSGSANATLAIAASGNVSLSGCVTLSPLTFGQFQIRSTAADGSFSACFGAGLTVSQNSVRILYNGLPLTTPTLPSFTIALDGSFSISVSASMTAGLTLDNYSLSGASFVFSVTGGTASAAKFGATLTIPSSPAGFPKAAVPLKLAGTLNSDATFALSGKLGASEALSSSLPFADVSAGATITLTQTGLTMTGTFVGGVLGQLPVVSTDITLAVASDGSMTAGGTVTSSALTDGQISISPVAGTTFTWTISNSGVSLPAFTAQVGVSGVFSSSIGLPAFTMSSNGSLSTGVFTTKGHVIAVNVEGYAFTSIKLTVTRSAGALAISAFAGNLNIPGFNQYLTGTINDAGTVALDFNGAVTLGGFTAASDGHLSLRNSGLSASGTLDISVSGTSLGSCFVVANIAAGSGSYSATAGTSLTLGGYSTSTFTASISSSGLSGSPNLQFGNLSVSLPNLSVKPAGVSGGGSAQRDTGWLKFVDVPGEVGDIYGRLEGTVSVSVSGTGSVSAGLSATFGWWVVTLNHCDPPPPFGDGACFYNYGPDPIPSDHGSGMAGSIGSDGKFCVNETICNPLNNCQNQFCFNLW